MTNLLDGGTLSFAEVRGDGIMRKELSAFGNKRTNTFVGFEKLDQTAKGFWCHIQTESNRGNITFTYKPK